MVCLTLYEIDEAIRDFPFEVDEDTGEILNIFDFDTLQMERNQKLENIVLYVKNLESNVRELKQEEDAFRKRRQSAERKANALRGYLSASLDGNNFETARCDVRFRKNPASVHIPDEKVFLDWACTEAPEFVKTKREPDKMAIKNALKSGKNVFEAQLVQTTSMVIK